MSKQIELYVDDEYYDLVPRPSKAQRRSLKESIKTDGLHEPITINNEGKILDGHTRFEICQELGIKPEYRIKDFKDKEAERLFVVTVNVRRRHLNDFQLLELLEKELQMISQKAKEDWYNSEHIGSGHKKEGAKKSDMKRQDRSVYKEIGEQLGMNPIRIEKFMQIKRHATTSVRESGFVN